MLMFLLLLPLARSTEISAPDIIFKSIKSCPDVGYFFQRDKSEEFGPCYLCFCKADEKAVCSKRPNGRCDPQHYVHQKRKTRITRALGFNDIFFRDAAREVFNTKLVQENSECTPLRASKSIGCPPDDWCTGCMVCDCDANGHWDCHIMSFCSTDKPHSADQIFSKLTPQKTYKGKGNLSQKTEKRSNIKKSSPFKKIDKKAVTYGNKGNSEKKKIVKKSTPHPGNILPETSISIQTKRQFTRKGREGKGKISPTVIKKYISTMSPIKSPELLKYKNDKKKLAQMLYKQFMSSPSKSPEKNQKGSYKNMGDKIMNKKTSNRKNKQIKQNMGDKIMNKKAANKKNINQTKQNTRKSMFNKGNKDIPKIMPMKTKHSNKNNKNKKRDNSKTKKKSNKPGKTFKGKKFNSKGSKMRSKRDVLSTATEITGNITNIENADGETTTHINQITNATEIAFTNSELIQQTLNNYAYTIDNNVTTSMINNQSVYNVTGYDTTEKNIDIVTINVNTLTSGNNVSHKNTTAENVTGLVTLIDSNLKSTTESLYIQSDSVTELNYTNAPKSEFNVVIDNMKTVFNPNQTDNINLSIKNKVHGQDIMKIIMNKKRFNLKKLVKNFNSGLNIENYSLIHRDVTNTNNTRNRINGTLNNIQTVLEKILQTATNNNTKRPSKQIHFTALKYIRKLFPKLFSKGSNKTADDKLGVMNSICDNFGPCNFSAKKIKIINNKVKELISETQKALNSIKIIQALLQLVYSEKKENGNATIKEANFKMHVRHLNAILKDNYIPEGHLTSTEVTQINYIKSNTKVFIKAIAKFGSILNDIINIIKSENTKNKHSIKMMKNKYSVHKQEDSVNKIKTLLFRYNLLQNTFLRKMYEALTKLEVKIKHQHAKVSDNGTQPAKNETYKMAIAKYVQNINDNLKKLQDLASRVDPKERRKRHTVRDDDAIEYLLTLMEYLMKRNYPQDSPPANDGIDLLIEAIRNAPDIKPIKKKVLQYVPVNINGAVHSEESKEASVHRDNSIKNKDVSENLKSNVKDKSYEDQSDNDDTREDRRLTKISSTKKTDTTTKINIVADLSDIVTEYPSKVYMATYYTEKNTARPFFEKRGSNAESTTKTVEPTKGQNSKKYAESDITDDDSIGLLQKARDFESVSQVDSTTVISSTENQNIKTKMRHFIPFNSEHKGKSTKEKTKTKLDLINEAYEEEIKEERAHTTAKPLKSRAKGETGKRNKKPLSNNVSSITAEVAEDEKINEAELINKKQMDLLNSLDYGTDRSVAEDSDSKDNSPVDRLSKDAFPNYFV